MCGMHVQMYDMTRVMPGPRAHCPIGEDLGHSWPSCELHGNMDALAKARLQIRSFIPRGAPVTVLPPILKPDPSDLPVRGALQPCRATNNAYHAYENT